MQTYMHLRPVVLASNLLPYVLCRIQGTSSESCHISTHSQIKLLFSQDESQCYLEEA